MGRMYTQVQVITVATHSEGYYEALKAGCEQANVSFVTLGWGQRWEGFAWKFSTMKSYLQKLKHEASKTSASTLFVFVDGFDVLPVFARQEDVIERYASLTNTDDIILGVNSQSESFLESIQAICNDLIFGKCMGRSLNSGVYAGPLTKLITLLDICLSAQKSEDVAHDDQYLLTRICRACPEWVVKNTKFDDEGVFVLNGTCALAPSVSRKLLRAVTKTDRRPMFIHGAGHCFMQAIQDELGLSLPHLQSTRPRSKSILARGFGHGGYAGLMLPDYVWCLWLGTSALLVTSDQRPLKSVSMVMVLLMVLLGIKYCQVLTTPGAFCGSCVVPSRPVQLKKAVTKRQTCQQNLRRRLM